MVLYAISFFKHKNMSFPSILFDHVWFVSCTKGKLHCVCKKIYCFHLQKSGPS